ncbi:uncharacterized protein EDB91DRAFT_1235730 [Suillus paluster]|uniref:uncharacterized protein n=1 Tax=Suillus paluster TaxID=48578 RepID=UPI001B87CD51|nr:uncharacterized protein EDB91DRAFT_1235730 [Suillus paluster]KAG1748444.1 hypothetical protein EDB91DRAFT_1235730 [Suillus paluster]
MCAAISHKFGRDYQLGTQPWLEHPAIPGKFIRNLSLSVTISQYMAENPSEWAGFLLCMMLYLLYLLSMLCLLHYDEALWITWADVTFQLELPFRKMHQYGGIAPFYIYADPDQPWMCLLHEDLNGFIFWKRLVSRFVDIKRIRLICYTQTSNSFLKCFRNNLLDISVDLRPYGTHLFHQGGCQFLHTVQGWLFRKICDWGGWAENFNNPGTIFKYLLSWNDNPAEAHEHYMNPNRPGCDPCYSCGRTCHCG